MRATSTFTLLISSVFAVMFLATPAPMWAQVGDASLSGSVSDPSGAGIPAAQVMLESTVEEHVSRRSVTDTKGVYVMPSLLPGSYRLLVEASGFETMTINAISLSSGQASTLNVSLRLGKTTVAVNVQDVSPLLQTATATVGADLGSKEAAELPLLGRNFSSLMVTLPGVSPAPLNDNPGDSWNLQGESINPSVYGQRQRSNGYTLDGVPNMEAIFNAQPMSPPPEAIAEMKVESGTDAEAYGWATGANINVVTKSGTTKYHGDAWEFLRNNDLNARSYFQRSIGGLQWNQFGFAGGGPLAIPRILPKNKAWYVFGFYDAARIRSAATSELLVPTAAELNGDFSADPPIYNAYTTSAGPNGQMVRQQFPGNQIPTGATNLCAPQPACINASTLLLAKALYPAANLPSGVIPGVNFISNIPGKQDQNQWSVRADHQFGQKDTFYSRFSDNDISSTSTTLPALPSVNSFRGQNLVVSETHMFDPTFLVTARYGMQRTNVQSFSVSSTDLASQAGTLSAYPAWHGKNLLPSIGVTGYPSIGNNYTLYGPAYINDFPVDARIVKGRSTISFGGGLLRTTFITDDTSAATAQFTSTPTSNFGGATGSAVASFLLGLPTSADREGGSSVGNMYGNAYSVYGQETFRATAKLTINLGVRWDYAPPMLNSNGTGTFVWETGQYLWDRTNPITGQPANTVPGAQYPDKKDIGPRVGAAYQLTPKTVLRASYGIFYDTFGSNYAQQHQGTRGNWPFGFPQNVTGLNVAAASALFPNIFPGPATGSTTPEGAIRGVETAYSATRTPQVQEWSFSVQRQITPSLKAEADYFGSHGIHLEGHLVDNTATAPGTDPYQDRQRWPSFPVYITNDYSAFPSWYDGLSLQLQQRLSHGLVFNANYTYSKTLDVVDSILSGNVYGQVIRDPTRFDIPDNKGPASYDLRQRFVLSFVYELPVKSQNKWANAVVGNWQVAGIASADNGVPYFVNLSTDNENIGTVSGRYTEFPNMIGNPDSGPQTIQQYFNIGAYQLPAFGTKGTAGKHALYADGQGNWDCEASKRWPFAGGEGRNVEFRAEFFNLLNSHTFDPPGALLGTSTFGDVSAVRQVGRNIEFALKIHF